MAATSSSPFLRASTADRHRLEAVYKDYENDIQRNNTNSFGSGDDCFEAS